jgi:hypothetical protein
VTRGMNSSPLFGGLSPTVQPKPDPIGEQPYLLMLVT